MLHAVLIDNILLTDSLFNITHFLKRTQPLFTTASILPEFACFNQSDTLTHSYHDSCLTCSLVSLQRLPILNKS